MRPLQVKQNRHFIGRTREATELTTIGKSKKPAIVIMYGRRRVGKTELLEQTFRNRKLLKFEGIAGKSEEQQMQLVMQQLALYAETPLLREIKITNWIDVFRQIHEFTKKGKWTIYFEEVQWLAQYQSDFINYLKYAWDNFFRHTPDLLVILCGSSPSFMVNQVIHSKSLYNRSQYEFALKEFNLIETRKFLSKYSLRDVMDAYLTVGGIPEYLLHLKDDSSILLSLSRNSFKADSFFSQEYEKIFISSLAENVNYKKIIEFLSKRRFATRSEITRHLKLTSGGRLTELLNDLELCEFAGKYTPYNLGEDSLLTRYAIQDFYLQFYYKFIKPIAGSIKQGKYNRNPLSALKQDSYYKWLGFAFERFCRRYHHIIANILNFGAVHYRAGAYFNRASEHDIPGYQIDLVFDRDDHVITLCEIRYLQSKVTSKVIAEFEKKLALFKNPKRKTIHKVLITSEGADTNLKNRAYFDRVITIKDLFTEHYWD